MSEWDITLQRFEDEPGKTLSDFEATLCEDYFTGGEHITELNHNQ